MSSLTYRDALRILELVDASAAVSFEFEADGTRIKLERRGSDSDGARPAPVRVQPGTPGSDAQKAPESAPGTPSAKAPGTSGEFPDAIAVSAPMVGVFYEAPAPLKPAFVEVGSEVKAGDQLGIIEVMKLFTPIKAPCDGVVVSILVENQETVAKDQALMLLDPR